MLEGVLEGLLIQYLAPYVDGISRDKLHLGVFSGALELLGLRVKRNALQMLGMENLIVTRGEIGAIKISVPWSALYSGKLSASIEVLHLEVEPSFEDTKAHSADSEAAILTQTRAALTQRFGYTGVAAALVVYKTHDSLPRDDLAAWFENHGVPDGKVVVGEILKSYGPLGNSGLEVRRSTFQDFLDPKVAKIKKMFRQQKSEAIQLRTTQLRDMLEQQQQQLAEAANGGGDKAGFGAKLVRKIINNLQINLKDIRLTMINRTHGLAYGVELEDLFVLSTNETFRVPKADEEVVVANNSMYKLLRLTGLGVRMANVGVCTLEDAEYVLSPVSASLQIAHVPSNQIFRVRLEVATEELFAFRLVRSQLKHYRGVSALASKDENEVRSLMVPHDVERSLFAASDGGRSALAEYGELWRRRIHDREDLLAPDSSPLSDADNERFQVLEDALSIRLLARQRWNVLREVEALIKEMDRRKDMVEKARAAEGGGKPGFFGRMFGRSDSSKSNLSEKVLWIKPEERELLLKDLEDESKVETVDLPQRMNLEFVLGTMALDLVDDRYPDEVGRQLLSMALEDADCSVGIAFKQDHLGQDSAAWRVEMRLVTFQAIKATQSLIAFRQPDEEQQSENAMEGKQAIRFVLENKLEATNNIMGISFDFAPLEMHMLPGTLENVLEFIRAPEVPIETQPQLVSASVRFEEGLDYTKQLIEAHGEMAKDVAEKLYDRIPDAMELKVTIAAPIFHIPVVGLGHAMISLGQLSIKTPQPCAYSDLDFRFDLTGTSVVAWSVRQERFDMINPVPINVTVKYHSDDEKSEVNIKLKIDELPIMLAPQALSILLSTPGAISAILNEAEVEPDGIVEESVVQHPVQPPPPQPAQVDAEGLGGRIGKRATIFVKEMAEETSVLQEALDAAANKLEKARAKQSLLNVTMSLGMLEITLADSIVPVMRLRLEFLGPGFVLKKTSLPPEMNIAIEDSAMEIELQNPRHGEWEPLVERFHLGINMLRAAPEGLPSSMDICLSGYQPLLLNLSPTTVRVSTWFVPFFLSSWGETPEAPKGEALVVANREAVKYRIMNLSSETFVLSFKSKHNDGLSTKIAPTGSRWLSLDEWILPIFATALTVSVPGGAYSPTLSLERTGAVAVPETGVYAEILTPHPSHRLILLASALRVHNCTDLPLVVRFHDAAQHAVLQVDVHETMTCEGQLLGLQQPSHATRSVFTDSVPAAFEPVEREMLLQPNSLCAVPASALVRAGGHGVHRTNTWLSVRPAVGRGEYCTPVKVGSGINPCEVFCRASSGGGDGGGGIGVGVRGGLAIGSNPNDVHLICEARTCAASSLRAMELTTIVLQPTLALLNSLPVGHLSVRYGDRGTTRWREAKIKSFERLNLYDCPGVLRDGISFGARLEDDAPWSSTAHFLRDVFTCNAPENEVTQVIHLRQGREGAEAGVTVEPMSGFEMRLSCPNWFIDRSGLEKKNHAMELRRRGALLPQYGGITLLPADCLEEEIELCLRDPGKTIASTCVRMPASWSVLSWNTPCGPFVFCLQVDDVNPADVLGAQCQLLTLRPRLVLTNSSEVAIEIRLAESNIIALEGGQSMEWHWQPNRGEEESPHTMLCFRPHRSPPCRWSSTMDCSDAAAGSSAFALPSVESADRCGVDVWSMEVAPVRGALAVSFRSGSEFVAVNRVKRTKIAMAIRPHGGPQNVVDAVTTPGKELPYGWAQPFQSEKQYAVEVILTPASGKKQKHFIDDVRRTVRRAIPVLNVVIVVSRVGSQTLLALEDSGGDGQSVQSESEEQNKGSKLRFELKLSRLGVSLVEELPTPRELLYMHLDLVRMEWSRNEHDVQQLKLAISEAQADCQLPDRVDASTADQRRGQSLGLLQSELPATIFANCGEGDRAFLSLVVRRGASSSRDTILSHAELALDSLDISIDEAWLDPVVSWLAKTSGGEEPGRSVGGGSQSSGVALKLIQQTAGRPIIVGYKLPPLPSVMQVDVLHLSTVDITLWCTLKLRSLRFLPAYLRTAIKFLTFSGSLSLDGAHLQLPARKFPPHRGSSADFATGLVSEYAMNLLGNVGSLLGKSSVINVARVPLRIGGAGVSYLSDTAGLVAGEGASLLTQLTFDDEYVAKQRQIRAEKRIQNLGDGMVEAGKSIGQGIEGLFDIVKKPYQGAQKAGIGGFFKGIGQGVAGTFVKPVSKLGQAISDVGSGIAAQVAPDSVSTQRRRARFRKRSPRLLYSELGAVRRYSALDAEILRQLGRYTHGVEVILPLTHHANDRQMRHMLILFPKHLLLSDVKDTTSQVGGASSSSAAFAPPLRQDSRNTLGRNKAGDTRDAPDVFEAIDETGRKLFSQALKPINTLVYGVQDIESTFSGVDSAQEGASCDPDAVKRTRRFFFSDLHSVHSTNDILELEDGQRHVISLPLCSAPCGDISRGALTAGFQAAQKSSVANWTELRSALLDEERGKRVGGGGRIRPTAANRIGVGERKLEVWECERMLLITGSWKTPFLPTDRESSWRWVDALGYRHPHIRKTLSRDDAAAQKMPPCELGELFREKSDWKKEVDELRHITDEEGWRYGLAWNSSTWDGNKGLFDVVRKRRWTKLYE